MIDLNFRRAALSAVLLLTAAPAFAQSAGVKQPRPHHANYAADVQYRRQDNVVAVSADRSLEAYHRPHHAE